MTQGMPWYEIAGLAVLGLFGLWAALMVVGLILLLLKYAVLGVIYLIRSVIDVEGLERDRKARAEATHLPGVRKENDLLRIMADFALVVRELWLGPFTRTCSQKIVAELAPDLEGEAKEAAEKLAAEILASETPHVGECRDHA